MTADQPPIQWTVMGARLGHVPAPAERQTKIDHATYTTFPADITARTWRSADIAQWAITRAQEGT